LYFFILCFILAHFFLNKLHDIWGHLKNLRFVSYNYVFYTKYKKIFYLILFSLVFSYARLEYLNVPDISTTLSILIGFLAFFRTSIISCLVLFQLFINDRRIENIWLLNSMVRKRYIHGSRINYGPGNLPPQLEAGAKAVLAGATAAGSSILAADAANRAATTGPVSHQKAHEAAKEAGQIAREAAKDAQRFGNIAKELLEGQDSTDNSSASAQIKEQQVLSALEGKADLERIEQKARELEGVAVGLMNEIPEKSTFQLLKDSYTNQGVVRGCLELINAAQGLQREAGIIVARTDKDLFTSVLEKKFFDYFPFFF
jgi:hypothetical protein